jgi:glucuronate isomerase
MKKFLDEDFLLQTSFAKELYHEYAANLPIIDFHNHLSPEEVAEDKIFKNITEAWLFGDHYKWRAMRANAIDEKYITGNASDIDKFKNWAATVPYTMRNPLYHWTHLELQRYFGITELLSEKSADSIYNQINEQLTLGEFSAQGLLRKMKVEVICTTDDPTDDLKWHQELKGKDIGLKMLPTFRPDSFIVISEQTFVLKLQKLEEIIGKGINTFSDLVEALKERIDFFHSVGGRLSDHGLSQLYAVDFTDAEADAILKKRLSDQSILKEEAMKFQTAMLYHLGKIYYAKGWTIQLHLGAIRDNNIRLKRQVGDNVGCDSIGDFDQAVGLSNFLKKLDDEEQLAKTILYNLNPRDNEVFAAMAGNFNDSSIANKIQWGPGWWFLDQKDGIEKQLNALSNMGMLSRFVGMLTDSRSFLSFPRHEYFRRILCNLIGNDVENGELPNDIKWLGKMVEDICYNNSKKYLGL